MLWALSWGVVKLAGYLVEFFVPLFSIALACGIDTRNASTYSTYMLIDLNLGS
jgi:hypothetical protein